MNSNYAVIAISNQRVVNIVVWDDETEWRPGKGYTVVKLEDGQFCNIGTIYNAEDGNFSYPVIEDDV